MVKCVCDYNTARLEVHRIHIYIIILLFWVQFLFLNCNASYVFGFMVRNKIKFFKFIVVWFS